MFRIIFLFSAILFFSASLSAQKEYFQQEVNYKIKVTLDDKRHILTGEAGIEYINNSPNSLDSIWFHLWGNAYKSKSSAFAKQKLSQGDTRFYFAEKKDLGSYGKVEFKINEKNAEWNLTKENMDVAILHLPEALKPGEKVNVQVAFELKIPASFSRLGHVGESYQLTQWYPKPAVYDAKGWHPFPYLDQGEFYSEFGTYEVEITLPRNYVVASTGVLQTQEEENFLREKVEATEMKMKQGFDSSLKFPSSAEEMKTIRYIAENVHDFAWFADKRFHVLNKTENLPAGKEVTCWAFFTNEQADLWVKATEYVGRAVSHYSELLGEYPYPQATAVQSALSAGAGMEYPMITVIGRAGSAKSLDRVITHEVGHNWFYGILASNERDHPWMDEGMNTYYENRYMTEYYQDDAEIDLPPFIKSSSPLDLNEIAYLLQARRNLDQAPGSPSEDFTFMNYGLDVYMKTGRAMKLLEFYLGRARFDSLMQVYYEEWKFRHPYPSDFKSIMEGGSEKDLDWFFDGLIQSNRKVDYAIKSIDKEQKRCRIHIENRGQVNAPFMITGLKDGQVVSSEWVEGFTGTKEIRLDDCELDEIKLDGEHRTFDLYRSNNQMRTSGLFSKLEPLEFRFIGGLENPEKTRINWIPAVGWNNYDKTLVGLAFYSFPIPAKRWEYALVPMYGTGSGNFTGLANLRYQSFPYSNWLKHFEIQADFRTFTYDYNPHYDFYDRFIKIAPKLTLDFAEAPTSRLSNSITYRFIHITQDYGSGTDFEAKLFERISKNYYTNELTYSHENRNVLAPFSFTITGRQGENFQMLFSHWQQKVKYQYKDKALRFHAFAGWMNQEDDITIQADFFPNGSTGTGLFQRDYLFDETLLGRNERDGVLSQQIYLNDASVKTPVGLIGSESWMIGAGIRSGIPNPLPIEPYIDIAVYPDPFDENETVFTYSAGLALILVRDIAEIYFPVFESEDITESIYYDTRKTYISRISFLLNFNELNPWKLRERL